MKNLVVMRTYFNNLWIPEPIKLIVLPAWASVFLYISLYIVPGWQKSMCLAAFTANLIVFYIQSYFSLPIKGRNKK